MKKYISMKVAIKSMNCGIFCNLKTPYIIYQQIESVLKILQDYQKNIKLVLMEIFYLVHFQSIFIKK